MDPPGLCLAGCLLGHWLLVVFRQSVAKRARACVCVCVCVCVCERERERERERETNRQTDRQTDRQAGRQADRDRDMDRQMDSPALKNCSSGLNLFSRDHQCPCVTQGELAFRQREWLGVGSGWNVVQILSFLFPCRLYGY